MKKGELGELDRASAWPYAPGTLISSTPEGPEWRHWLKHTQRSLVMALFLLRPIVEAKASFACDKFLCNTTACVRALNGNQRRTQVNHLPRALCVQLALVHSSPSVKSSASSKSVPSQFIPHSAPLHSQFPLESSAVAEFEAV